MTPIKHPSIGCVADEIDCKEHEIWVGTRRYLVLMPPDLGKEDARLLAQEHDRNRNERELESRKDDQRELLP